MAGFLAVLGTAATASLNLGRVRQKLASVEHHPLALVVCEVLADESTLRARHGFPSSRLGSAMYIGR